MFSIVHYMYCIGKVKRLVHANVQKLHTDHTALKLISRSYMLLGQAVFKSQSLSQWTADSLIRVTL